MTQLGINPLDQQPAGAPDEENLLSDDLRPLREVYASLGNISRLGLPSDHKESIQLRYYIYPTWRAQILPLISYFVLCILTVVGSRYIELLVIKGPLFIIGETQYWLHLPILILLPGFMLGKVLIFMYDCKYMIDDNGVEAQVGLASMSLRQPRLRYEDIRGVEPNQTIWERILGIGSVLVGSAMTGDVEIVMEGVPNPRAIQVLVNKERDRHLHKLIEGGSSGNQSKLVQHRILMTD